MEIQTTLKRLFLLSVLAAALPGTAAAQANLRKRTGMDEGWRFHFGHASDPAKDYNYGIANIFAKSGATTSTALGAGFNDSGWRRLDLPHDWAVELPFVQSPSFDVTAHGYKPVGGLFPGT